MKDAARSCDVSFPKSGSPNYEDTRRRAFGLRVERFIAKLHITATEAGISFSYSRDGIARRSSLPVSRTGGN
jgi:hypothetical protein